MRHTLRASVASLVSALLVAGLITGAPMHAHAATGAKPVLSWGDNQYGLVGDGTTKLRRRPVRAVGLSDVSSITYYSNSTYAVKKDGTVWRWGRFYVPNPSDPDAAGTSVTIKTPTQVAGLSGVTAIAVEQYSRYAIRSDGTVWSWEYLNAPAPMDELTDVASISPDESGDGGYALKRDGTVWEFHGDGYLLPGNLPWPGTTRVAGIDGVSRLTTGKYSDGSDTEMSWYALKSDGTVWAWGDNRGGQLGDGTTVSRTTPAQVAGLGGVAKVTAGTGAAFVVTTTGSVWAWGVNEGQLGDGTKTNRATPVRLPVLSKVAEVIPTADSYSSRATWYARTTGGILYYWGGGWPNEKGDLAAKYYRSGKVPMQVPGLSGVRKAAAYEVWGGGSPGSFGQSGTTGGYAVKSDGTLWAWGGHVGAAQSGLWKPMEAWAPTRIRGISSVTSVFPYDSGAYAIGKPTVSLGAPVAPKTMKKSKSYTVYGSLKPEHTKGTKPVRIFKYKKVGKKWVRKGYVMAKAYNYKTYTRYKVKMKLTSRGRWRLRAYAPADSKHAATWSTKYDYVTVK